MSNSLHDPQSVGATTLPRLSRCHAPEGVFVSDSSIDQPASRELRGDDPRRAFGHQVASMAVVTTCQRGAPAGILISSLASISAEPPVVSFSISATSWAWPALEQAQHIGVNLLAAGQEPLAKRFSPDHTDGFHAPLPWQPGPYGVPLLEGCLAWAVAQPTQMIHTGNHVIIVSRLLQGRARDDATPLLTRLLAGPPS